MRIGIVSDLHGSFHRNIYQALDGCERILCAGDVERDDILWQLETIAPVIAVRGNNDWALQLPQTSTIELAGLRFYMVHILYRGQKVPEGTQVVVFGHLHVPSDEVHGGIRYLNPGSTTYPRGGSKRSCMVMQAHEGLIESVDLVELDDLTQG